MSNSRGAWGPITATDAPASAATPRDRTEEAGVLEHFPSLAEFPIAARAELEAALEKRIYERGDVIVREGDLGDRMFFLSEGQVEVWTERPGGRISLATLGPGEIFGELALFSPTGRRSASVSALSPAVTFSIPAERLRTALGRHPEARAALEGYADRLAIAHFISEVAAFTALDDAQRRVLAERVEPLAVEAGEEIIAVGEPGDTCYLLRHGRVEILSGEAEPRRVDTLGAGALFGETALLTGAPRSATVRALEPSQLLVLSRDDLLEAIEEDARVATRVTDLLRLRERPSRVAGVLVERRTSPEGEPIAILKDPERLTYYRLSAPGLFVWDRLDGTRNVRELTLEYMHEHQVFAPHAIADAVAGLAAAGFARVRRVQTDFALRALRPDTRVERAARVARGVLEWRVSWRGLDRPLGAIYEHFLRPLYTLPGQLALGVLAVAGLAAFIAVTGRATAALDDSAAPLAAIIPAQMFAILVHEAGHAFTTKAFGREVPRAGVGWYWFGPIAFVDTSDMWLASRRQRILVSVAGPYAEAMFAGALSLAALAMPDDLLAAALWSAALPLYASVLLNFNPLLEFDGYYILSDLLDRPNLRPRALEWIGKELPAALRDRTRLRGHGVDLLYGVASLAYVIAMGLLTLILYRLTLSHLLSGLLGEPASIAIGWAFAVAIVVLTLVGSVGDLRGQRASG